eukprot:CAMPEP_0172668432 /NCGR_PEP_ID=MMETSP1074-20121228/9055_1 /TAXON_ID=2916 /ORGANISM="Ceratium fusus, Strain PA161109" /LENGTH=568 /DNA_ID=CAMNT_0013485079 /DNA_START=46 /DNA_END=1752 /DNA_ORIENTATION=+
MSAKAVECPFDCIVVTAANERQARSYDAELQRRQQLGVLPESTLLVSVADPRGARVGSGGGTLNALMAAVSCLRSSRESNAAWKILCIHSGGDSQRSPSQSVCGKAWSALNCVGPGGHCYAPIDLLCLRLFRLCQGLAPGSFVVASCDVLLMFPDAMDASVIADGVWGLAIEADQSFGPHHGVYVTGTPGQGGPVTKFLQKASIPELTEAGALLPDGQVLVDSGVVAFDEKSTTTLLQLCSEPPFDGCVGAAEPFRFELYSDIMLALGGVLRKEEYLSLPDADKNPARARAGRERLWDRLEKTPFSAVMVPTAKFAHLGTTAELLAAQTGGIDDPFVRHFGLVPRAFSHGSPQGEGVCVNSVLVSGDLGAGALVEHCILRGSWSAGPGALLSGLRLEQQDFHVGPNIAVQQVALGGAVGDNPDVGGTYVLLVFGVQDPIKAQYASSKARLCGASWHDILAALGATPDDIWPAEVSEADRNLWTARLHPALQLSTENETVPLQLPPLLLQTAAIKGPVPAETAESWRLAKRYSLKELLAEASPATEFEWRQRVAQEVRKLGPDPEWPVV